MKVTKKLYILCIALLCLQCDNDDNLRFSNESGKFVRFFFQLDQNNKPIEAPAIESGIPSVSEYHKDNVNTIKIPVALTSEPLASEVMVAYSAVLNNITNINITPLQLSFNGTQLVDTLFVAINDRWDPANNPSLVLTLESTSDESITIGMPNMQQPHNQLTINFNEVLFQYGIESGSRIDVNGTNGETYEITVGFDNGYLPSDIAGIDLLQETQSNFNYTLQQLPLTSSSEIIYNITVDQDFTDDDLLYKTSFALNNIPGYSLTGVPNIAVIRDPISPRDLTLNTASQFYNTNDPFYRTYGVNWMDFNEDGICEWRDWNAFTVPVEVPETDPNAILGDDMGTTDPSDDIYYHAFRIGFQPPNVNTTNAFNLKRWFTNESSSATNSPGFNINPALEFYPDNGTSATSGTVQVIEQVIQIGTSASNGSITEFITISGNGTYSEISPGVYEIILDFNATNNRLFGGTRSVRYHIFNTNNFTDPPLLNESCFTPQAL